MPSLVLFKHKTLLAGDDLKFPMRLAIAFRVIQLIMIVPMVVILQLDKSQNNIEEGLSLCEERGLSTTLLEAFVPLSELFCYLSLVLSIIGVVMFSAITAVSGLGTPTETKPRSNAIKMLCHIDLTLLLFARACSLIAGLHLAGIYAKFCTCSGIPPEDYKEDGVADGSTSDATNRPGLKAACEGYHSSIYFTLFLGTLTTQMVDGVYGIYMYLLVLKNFFPIGLFTFVSMQARWECCCRAFFCCLSVSSCCQYGGLESFLSLQASDMRQLAALMNEYFCSNDILDVTPSDILAGLYMMRLSHRHEELLVREKLGQLRKDEEARGKDGDGEQENEETALAVLPQHRRLPTDTLENIFSNAVSLDKAYISALFLNSFPFGNFRELRKKKAFAPALRDTLDPDNPYERYLVAEGARFISFAEAIYDWSKTKSTVGKIFNKLPNKLTNTAGGVLSVSPICGIDPEDIVITRFRQGIVATPYAIVIDKEWKSIVVTIRGTLTLEDILGDFQLEAKELVEVGERCSFDGREKYCHSGILACAEWIYSDLQRHNKLHHLLLDESSEYKNYRLRITGHSLGAGCAVILSLMLRSTLFPRVRCVAFSPPGCCVSDNLAQECSSWTTSYMLDSDVIPRFSIESMSSFRDEILETVARIRIPKYTVMANRNIDAFGKDMLCEFLGEALFPKEEIPPTLFFENLKEFRSFKRKRYEELAIGIHLYTPGKIIQLIRTRSLKKKSGGRSCQDDTDVLFLFGQDFYYTARYVDRNELRRIVLSTHFLSDHETKNVRSHLVELAEVYKLEDPYSAVMDACTSEA